jgi:hypothetical protein
MLCRGIPGIQRPMLFTGDWAVAAPRDWPGPVGDSHPRLAAALYAGLTTYADSVVWTGPAPPRESPKRARETRVICRIYARRISLDAIHIADH